jgi:hypothetical protein
MAPTSGVLCMCQGILLIYFCLTIRFQMGIYVALGVGQAAAAYMTGGTLAMIVYSASRRLHDVCHSGSLFFSI